jgi:hypothetical protein
MSAIYMSRTSVLSGVIPELDVILKAEALFT